MDRDAAAEDAGTANPTEDTPEAGSAEDTKARFRAALDRKQQTSHRGGEGQRNTGSVHGPEVVGGGRKSFRRKTG